MEYQNAMKDKLSQF